MTTTTTTIIITTHSRLTLTLNGDDMGVVSSSAGQDALLARIPISTIPKSLKMERDLKGGRGWVVLVGSLV